MSHGRQLLPGATLAKSQLKLAEISFMPTLILKLKASGLCLSIIQIATRINIEIIANIIIDPTSLIRFELLSVFHFLSAVFMALP